MIKVEYHAEACRRITKYPSLGISDNGTIVLFTAEGEGVCLSRNEYSVDVKPGEYSDLWHMSNFFLLDGEITLRNT